MSPAMSSLNTTVPWELPPERLPEPTDEVQLWLARLEMSADEQERLCQSLSAEEWARAARFLVDQVRRRFMAGRGVLRAILGRYLACSPDRVRLTYGLYGKPALSGGSGAEPLSFNLAHSGDLLLCAVSRGRKVGVDVEAIRPVAPSDHMARLCLNEAERAEFYRLPVQARPQAFARSWTCKEACLKANGVGMSQSLHSIAVTLGPDLSPRVLQAPEGEVWSVVSLMPAPGYSGALAVQGKELPLRYWRWAQ